MKATFCKPSSIAVLAPRQNDFNINSNEILLGYLSARPTEYSPLPQPSSKTTGLSFLKKSAFHFP
jgi:hypothetical protein